MAAVASPLSVEAEVGGRFQLQVVDSLGRDLIPIVIAAQRCGSRDAAEESPQPDGAARSLRAAQAGLDKVDALAASIAASESLEVARPSVEQRRLASADAVVPLSDAVAHQEAHAGHVQQQRLELARQRRDAEKLFERLGIEERLRLASPLADVRAALATYARSFATRPRARGAGPLIGPQLTALVAELQQLSGADAEMYSALLRGEQVDPADCEARLRARQALVVELHARLDAAEEAAYVLGSSVLRWLQVREQQKEGEVKAAVELLRMLKHKQQQLKCTAEDEARADAGLAELRALSKQQVLLQSRLNAAKNNLQEAEALLQLQDDDDCAGEIQDSGAAKTPGRPSVASLQTDVKEVALEQSTAAGQRRHVMASLRELVSTVPQLRLNPLVTAVPMAGLRLREDAVAVPRVAREIGRDYDQVAKAWASSSGRVVFAARYHGDDVLLKSFATNRGTTGEAEAEVERELSFSRLQHPNIIRLSCFFYDPSKNATYLQMPPAACGTFRQWALSGGTSKEPWRLQSAGAQILHALCYIHGAGVVHRALTPDSVVMVSDTEVKLSDFSSARSLDDTSTDTGGTRDRDGGGVAGDWGGGTAMIHAYAAPEVHEAAGGGRASTSQDMWSFGAIMFEAHRGSVPFMLPGAERVDASDTNPRLVALLGRCLSRSPAARPSSAEALAAPYFTVSLVHDLHEGREVSTSAIRIQAFYTFLEAARRAEDTGTVKEITVDRPRVADYLLERCGPSWIKRSFRVVFNGEAGADAGGLTTELFRLFFLQVAHDETPERLFERGCGGCYLPCPATGTYDQPRLERLRVYGHVLAKCLLDGRFCAIRLAPSLLKYLLEPDAILTLRDLECFDPEYARQLQLLLASPGYSELIGITFEGLRDGGEDEDVDETSKQEFVRLKIKHILSGSRAEELVALREGFCAAKDLQPQLQVLTASDLALIIHGPHCIAAGDVLAVLRFDQDGFPAGSGIGTMLKEVLSGMEEVQLRQFLLFATGESTIPIGGLRNPNLHAAHPRHITIARNFGGEHMLPMAHICTYTVDLPLYPSAALLSEKLALALVSFECQGFMLA